MNVSLNESQNFAWNIRDEGDCLGEGANGKVYRGVEKKTGAEVAIKTFKIEPLRELRILRDLSHPNIIKLLAVETNIGTGKRVMVMEFCNAGSLMQLLKEQENVCGLSDDEFLLVLNHLTSGLEYLRRFTIIHRDVKPDNIVRHINVDGSTSYKLTDFGAARELPDGAMFVSLQGTEAYANPGIYQEAFFGGSVEKSCFGIDTDLWSVGVTLYQIATGRLPFPTQRTLRLRIFKEMAEREDVVAATEDQASGEIIYHTEMPCDSRLSVGLREMITPIIAGLFIRKSETQRSFIQYYEQVLDVVSRKVVKVFCVNEMRMVKIYMKSGESFCHFKSYVYEQTKIPTERQVFLYECNLVRNCDPDLDILHVSTCLVLFDQNSHDVKAKTNFIMDVALLSNLRFHFMVKGVQFDLLRKVRRELYVFKNLMDHQSMTYKHVHTFMTDFLDFCKETVKRNCLWRNSLLEENFGILKQLQILEKFENLGDSSGLISTLEARTDRFVFATDQLFQSFQYTIFDIDFTSHDSYLKRVVVELDNTKRLITDLCNKQFGPALVNCKKLVITHSVNVVLETFTLVMRPNFEKFLKQVQEWYGNKFLSCLTALDSLSKEMDSYKDYLYMVQNEVHCRTNTLTVPKTGLDSWRKLSTRLSNHQQCSVDSYFLLRENAEYVRNINNLLHSLD